MNELSNDPTLFYRLKRISERGIKTSGGTVFYGIVDGRQYLVQNWGASENLVEIADDKHNRSIEFIIEERAGGAYYKFHRPIPENLSHLLTTLEKDNTNRTVYDVAAQIARKGKLKGFKNIKYVYKGEIGESEYVVTLYMKGKKSGWVNLKGDGINLTVSQPEFMMIWKGATLPKDLYILLDNLAKQAGIYPRFKLAFQKPDMN